MDKLLESLPSGVSIADEVCVYGENEAEHDSNF